MTQSIEKGMLEKIKINKKGNANLPRRFSKVWLVRGCTNYLPIGKDGSNDIWPLDKKK